MGFFLVGLQYTHLAEIGPLQTFTLTLDSVKTWTVTQWLLFIGQLVVVALILYADSAKLTECGVAYYYLLWAGTIFGFFVWHSERLIRDKKKREYYTIHVHYPCLALCFMSLLGYQSELLTFVHGVAMGLFIEGGCRQGFSPIWVKKKHPWWWHLPLIDREVIGDGSSDEEEEEADFDPLLDQRLA